ncbi:hypothetical protein [Pseudoalteromonas phenolica]|uniref:Uncharacterized protein n=1 Tax=Pseudoalteromonas phenolica TaxID=161398 RepID=A0A0S2K3D5_9GAMM|nr:hypothetical protein [Pseudoalteromonas phenolica]ALO42565.1 hypothetical protein PP2015_2067 [Pseudoalteromonas phenolica]MBE0356330.1 hypothetical protein [Pseudoalteromonas phenolica O-BC30]
MELQKQNLKFVRGGGSTGGGANGPKLPTREQKAEQEKVELPSTDPIAPVTY